MAANVQGYEATKRRQFCASCHVMGPHAKDAEDPASHSLAAIHARNPYFGSDNCYACHSDYGLFGTVVTKAGGLRHVYLYITQYRNKTLDEARREIHLMKPFQNTNCMQCHTTKAPRWLKNPDHLSALENIQSGQVSCASKGCHGTVHPLTANKE
jgi:cytochrome c-type protein NapC